MTLEFRLSPPGSGRGTSCDANGAFVGVIPLLQRSTLHGTDRWEPRRSEQLSKQLSSSFGIPVDVSSKMGGLKAISNALNDGDIAKAQIATVLLGIPDLPPLTKDTRSREAMVQFIRALHWSGMIKANWDPDEHPRWPAGAPDGQGGEFAPKGITAPDEISTRADFQGEQRNHETLRTLVAEAPGRFSIADLIADLRRNV